jgi:hypothetical protein
MSNPNSLYKKLHKIQNEVQIKKDGKGYNYKYATLDAISESIKQLCIKEELIWIHTFNRNQITCHLIDCTTGDELTSTLEMPEAKEIVNAAGKVQQTIYQSAGSGITYYRRYTLLSILGLLTDEDIDGSPMLIATNDILLKIQSLEDPILLNNILSNQQLTGKDGKTYVLTNEQINQIKESKKITNPN